MIAVETDTLVDRRRLRRKLLFWRILAFLAGILAIGGLGLMLSGREGLPGEEQIARISIEGVITGDKPLLKVFEDAAKAQNVKAVIVDIDSPGGTVTGSEALYDAIRDLSTKKPTVAVIDSVGASGGYIAALAADRIYARSSAVVGSIGVIAQFPNVSKLLANLGVEVEAVRSSPLKAMPSGLEPTPPEARAALEAMLKDNFDWFRGIVKERRQFNDGQLLNVADGRVFTGRQAVPLKLIDATGDEKDAIAWLESDKKIKVNLPVRNWKRQQQDDPLSLFSTMALWADKAGFSLLSDLLLRGSSLENTAKLDGMLFLWRPLTN
jgi:protease IV